MLNALHLVYGSVLFNGAHLESNYAVNSEEEIPKPTGTGHGNC